MKRQDISGLEKNSSIYFKIGLIISLGFTIMAFNFTVYDNNVYTDLMPTPEIEDIVDVIRTPPERPKPLPPPPKVEAKEILATTETPEFVEQPVPEKIPLEIPAMEKAKPIAMPPRPVVKQEKPKPPVPAPEIEEADAVPEVWKVVEEMPRFGDCTDLETRQEREACSTKNLLKFVYSNIKYPALARENGIEGTVVISFIIDETGKPVEPEIMRDIGGGCGHEALRVVQMMADWHAGMQQGKKVKVMFNLPVKFSLR